MRSVSGMANIAHFRWLERLSALVLLIVAVDFFCGATLLSAKMGNAQYLKVLGFAQEKLTTIFVKDKIFFHFSPEYVGPSEIQDMSQRYEATYNRINAKLGIQFGEPVDVYLYPEKMEVLIQESLPYLSQYNLTSNEIHVYYTGLQDHGQIEHEMVHVMTAHLGNFRAGFSPSALLVEGLAEYIVAQPWNLGVDKWVKGFLDQDMYIPLAGLHRDHDFRGQNQIIAYEEAGSFVKYLIETYGLEKFKLLYSRPSFFKTYGKSLCKLEKKWLDSLAAIVLQKNELDLIGFRVTLGDIYKTPALLGSLPWIGVQTTTRDNSVFIDKVISGSPAEKGDLRYGDEIIRINGTEIDAENVWRIYALLFENRSGDAVTFSVRRDEEILNSTVMLSVNPKRTIN